MGQYTFREGPPARAGGERAGLRKGGPSGACATHSARAARRVAGAVWRRSWSRRPKAICYCRERRACVRRGARGRGRGKPVASGGARLACRSSGRALTPVCNGSIGAPARPQPWRTCGWRTRELALGEGGDRQPVVTAFSSNTHLSLSCSASTLYNACPEWGRATYCYAYGTQVETWPALYSSEGVKLRV